MPEYIKSNAEECQEAHIVEGKSISSLLDSIFSMIL